MPRVGRRHRPDPDGVFVSREAFAADDLNLDEYPGGVVPRGVLLRGSDPLVAAHAEMFVPAAELADQRKGTA